MDFSACGAGYGGVETGANAVVVERGEEDTTEECARACRNDLKCQGALVVRSNVTTVMST